MGKQRLELAPQSLVGHGEERGLQSEYSWEATECSKHGGDVKGETFSVALLEAEQHTPVY